jgi:hypothetical protein
MASNERKLNKKGNDISALKNKRKDNAKSWFLGIGINTYQSPIPALKNASKDVEDVIFVLKERYELDKVLTLYDREATRVAIMDKFQTIDEEIGKNDRLIIYYSGHGYLDRKERGYWLPADAEKERVASFIHNATIREFIGGIEAKHILLISDSCFSGSLLARSDNSRSMNLEELESDPSRWVISSGRLQELVADGTPGDNSPFAKSLISVLNRNEEELLNTGLLFDKVMKMTRFNYKQLPQSGPLYGAGHQGGQYLFRLKVDETKVWDQVKESERVEDFYQFLSKFPNGIFANEATRKIETLEELKDWHRTALINRIDAYEAFRSKYPNSIYTSIANIRIAKIRPAKVEAKDSKVQGGDNKKRNINIKSQPIKQPEPPNETEEKEKSKKEITEFFKLTPGARKNDLASPAPLPEKSKSDDPLYDERIPKLLGIFLMFISLHFFVSLTSYLFTWRYDEDKVLRFSGKLLQDNIEMANWLGRLGALISHTLVYRGFGISSFILVYLLAVSGLYLLGKITLKKYLNIVKYGGIIMGLLSICLGVFFYQASFSWGGAFGKAIAQTLIDLIGSIGAITLSIVILSSLGYFFYNRYNKMIK